MFIYIYIHIGEWRELASDILLKSRVREVPVVQEEKSIEVGEGEEKGEEKPEDPEGESNPEPQPQVEEDPDIVAAR